MTNDIKVYGIDADLFDDNIIDLTDKEFIDIAEEYGAVWTLNGFAADFNNEEISNTMFIRHLNPENYRTE